MPQPKAVVKGIATHLPERRLTNEQLATEYGDWTAEKIEQKTGIVVRAVAGPEECASDLGYAAAQRLFESGVCAPADVDFLLFCTQSPDYFLPTTACLLQDRLGLPRGAGALDFNLGCSGFVYGLSMAKGLIESGQAKNVLLITSETYSKYIHPKDRSARTIFSDGAAATWITGCDSNEELLGPFVYGTDGRGGCNLIVPAGALRTPHSPATAREETDESGNVRAKDNLYMNGPEIFNFTLEAVHLAVRELVAKCGRTIADVDYVVPHQANRFMLDHLRRKSKIPAEKFCVNVEHFGNTVSSTIPMALERAMQDGAVGKGANVMIIGFGVGYSWSAGMMRLAF
ncbi:MAG: ketoacyl-ACP synthase III [Candidatus Hydrogenedentes bacterium]|nr:ketoacyl-ACP synthase III [Candidatus Hydrogenedentota bacterium]